MTTGNSRGRELKEQQSKTEKILARMRTKDIKLKKYNSAGYANLFQWTAFNIQKQPDISKEAGREKLRLVAQIDPVWIKSYGYFKSAFLLG